jgi:plasmid stability protein
MTDMLIRKVDPKLKREIERRAREHGRSLSDEAKIVLQRGLSVPEPPLKMGTYLTSLLPDEYRGDDLVFEYRSDIGRPPEFE